MNNISKEERELTMELTKEWVKRDRELITGIIVSKEIK